MIFTSYTVPQLISHLQGKPQDEQARTELQSRSDRHDYMDPNPQEVPSMNPNGGPYEPNQNI